jgi:nitric oxide reductase NorQ protein
MDYLPNEVEIEVLEKKAGVSHDQAREIISVVNDLRASPDLDVDVSTRKALMIAEMIAAGATLRDAVTASLQANRGTLESILQSLHVSLGKVQRGRTEYTVFSSGT